QDDDRSNTRHPLLHVIVASGFRAHVFSCYAPWQHPLCHCQKDTPSKYRPSAQSLAGATIRASGLGHAITRHARLGESSMFCGRARESSGWLSCVAVLGLLAQLALGAWWIDAVTSLAIVWFLVKEGREAWRADTCGCCAGA